MLTVCNKIYMGSATGQGYGSGASYEIIELTGDSGTLTAEQIDLVNDTSKLVRIINDGKVFSLSNASTSLTYKTFTNTDAAVGEVVSFEAIYVQLNPEAVNYGTWSKEEVFVGGANGLVLDIGQGQDSYLTYVIPKIEKADAITAYEAFSEGKHVSLLWTLLGSETYLNILSVDEINGTYSIDVLLHNQFHISYQWNSETEEYCSFTVKESGE